MNKLETSNLDTTKIKQDDSDKLFDSTYWDNQDVFEGLRCRRGNWKYTQNYVFDVNENKRVGSNNKLTAEDYCGYRVGYIKPNDKLYYYSFNDRTDIKTVNFNDLIIYAIRCYSSKYIIEPLLTILFRNFKNGDIYAIEYHIPLYEDDETDMFYYTLYAEKVEDDAIDILLQLIKKDNSFKVYNSSDYISKQRKYKISQIVE